MGGPDFFISASQENVLLARNALTDVCIAL